MAHARDRVSAIRERCGPDQRCVMLNDQRVTRNHLGETYTIRCAFQSINEELHPASGAHFHQSIKSCIPDQECGGAGGCPTRVRRSPAARRTLARPLRAGSNCARGGADVSGAGRMASGGGGRRDEERKER
eukprot:965446-Rhodomonas_salina.1